MSRAQKALSRGSTVWPTMVDLVAERLASHGVPYEGARRCATRAVEQFPETAKATEPTEPEVFLGVATELAWDFHDRELVDGACPAIVPLVRKLGIGKGRAGELSNQHSQGDPGSASILALLEQVADGEKLAVLELEDELTRFVASELRTRGVPAELARRCGRKVAEHAERVPTFFASQDARALRELVVELGWKFFGEECCIGIYPSILSYLRRRVGNKHDAEDLAQDVAMRILIGFSGFRPGSLFAPWAFKIASNRFTDWLRSQERRPSHETVEDDSLENPASSSDFDKVLAFALLRPAITLALTTSAALPLGDGRKLFESERRAVEAHLSIIEETGDDDYIATASLLGEAVATVAGYLSKGFGKLVRLLEDQGYQIIDKQEATSGRGLVLMEFRTKRSTVQKTSEVRKTSGGKSRPAKSGIERPHETIDGESRRSGLVLVFCPREEPNGSR